MFPGHFTQVVWKDCSEVGVGLATDGQTIFVVGQYHPAGNMCNAGYFEKNVLPLGSSTSSAPKCVPTGNTSLIGEQKLEKTIIFKSHTTAQLRLSLGK